jgi:hypothetical protein
MALHSMNLRTNEPYIPMVRGYKNGGMSLVLHRWLD